MLAMDRKQLSGGGGGEVEGAAFEGSIFFTSELISRQGLQAALWS